MLGINPGVLGPVPPGRSRTRNAARRTSEYRSKASGRMNPPATSSTGWCVPQVAQGVLRPGIRARHLPFGFTRIGPTGRPVNLNYYDDKDLQGGITPFVHRWLKALVATGMRTDPGVLRGHRQRTWPTWRS